MFDRLGEPGCELAVPSHVCREELISADVRAMIADLVDRGTMRIVCMNRRSEVLDLEMFQGAELGQCDVILTCIKMRRRGDTRCVLDEKGARVAAGQAGV